LTVIINFFGGPGAGKTERAVELYNYMNEKGLDVAYVPEYASKLINSGRADVLINHPLYVFSVQTFWITRYINRYNYVITDSPMLLSYIYIDDRNRRNKLLKKFILNYSETFNNVNIYVVRGKYLFTNKGRIHTEEESVKLDADILSLFNKERIEYITLKTEDTVADMYNMLKSHFHKTFLNDPYLKSWSKQDMSASIVTNMPKPEGWDLFIKE